MKFVIGASALATGIVTQQYFADEPKNKTSTAKHRELTTANEMFKHYASVQRDGEFLMTPGDFLRFITPYHNVHELNISEDGSVGNSNSNSLKENLWNIFKSIDQNGDGLLSYPEFIFFTTLLAIPPKYFRIAFRLFDEDGNGRVDKFEFRNIMNMVQCANPLSKNSSAPVVLQSEISYPVFFGADGKRELEFEEFQGFILNLRDAVLRLQFNMISNGKDSISAKEYALNVISYTNPEHQRDYAARVSSLRESEIRISYEEFQAFNVMLEHLDDVDFTLRSFVALDQPFTKAQLQQATSAASDVRLSLNVLDVLFYVFDKNGDGLLDYAEFVEALQGKQSFGFVKPRENYFTRMANCVKFCWDEEVADRYAKVI